jgi:hypothetical protein
MSCSSTRLSGILRQSMSLFCQVFCGKVKVWKHLFSYFIMSIVIDRITPPGVYPYPSRHALPTLKKESVLHVSKLSIDIHTGLFFPRGRKTTSSFNVWWWLLCGGSFTSSRSSHCTPSFRHHLFPYTFTITIHPSLQWSLLIRWDFVVS